MPGRVVGHETTVTIAQGRLTQNFFLCFPYCARRECVIRNRRQVGALTIGWSSGAARALKPPLPVAMDDRRARRYVGPSSMVNQYAEDGCRQHSTKHDVDRFKCVPVPHQKSPSVAMTVFNSRTAALRHPWVAHEGQHGFWSFGVIPVASVTAAPEEFGISINGG
jgi:hypothetical protein